jgi:putative tricarboxylic transport membrane protein
VGYDRIGPRFFPTVVAAGLVLLGVWLAAGAVHASRKNPPFDFAHGPEPVEGRHKERPRQAGTGAVATGTEFSETDFRTNCRALGLLAAGLLLCLALLERGGFVIASSVLFWTAARGFGSRRPWRDAGVAVALAVVVFLAFTRGLGLALPLGVLGGLGK